MYNTEIHIPQQIEILLSSVTEGNYPMFCDAVDNLKELIKDDVFQSTIKYYNKIKELGLPVIKDSSEGSAHDKIVRSRNIIRQYFLDKNYDFFFSLEQDIIPPKDVIERMLAHKKDIVTGVVYTQYKFNGKLATRPILWTTRCGPSSCS